MLGIRGCSDSVYGHKAGVSLTHKRHRRGVTALFTLVLEKVRRPEAGLTCVTEVPGTGRSYCVRPLSGAPASSFMHVFTNEIYSRHTCQTSHADINKVTFQPLSYSMYQVSGAPLNDGACGLTYYFVAWRGTNKKSGPH